MKVFSTAVLFAAASVATVDVAPEAKATDAAVTDNRDLQEYNVQADYNLRFYYTGSCTCAQDAWGEIMDAASDAIGDCIPLETAAQNTLPPYITALEHCAIEWLSGMDCGCGDDYKIPLWTDHKISTYQCCCDVNAVKDIVIHHINEIKNSWMTAVNMQGHLMPTVIGKVCTYERYEKILQRVTYAFRQILDEYAEALFYGSATTPECKLETAITCPSTVPI